MKSRNFQPLFNGVLGVKQGIALTNMPDGSLVDTQNMYRDNRGGTYMRQGYSKLFSLPINQETRQLHEYKQMSGTQYVMAYAHDTIYRWNGTVVSAVKTGCAMDTDWAFVTIANRCLGVNGADSFDYNGTNFYKIGVSAPTAHIGLVTAANPASTLDGHYAYLITFYDSNRTAESNPYTVATAPSADAGPAGTNNIVLGPFPAYAAGEFATHYRIYRKWIENDAGILQETVFTRVAELAYGTYVGTTYADTGLATGDVEIVYDNGQLDTGHTPPLDSNIIIEMWGRLFIVPITDRTLLTCSIAGKTHAFPSANYFPIGNQDGEPIIRVEKNGSALAIHKKNSVYILSGDPDTNTPIRLNGRGTAGKYSSCSDVDGAIYRLSQDGFYYLAPTDYSLTDLRDEYIGQDVSEEEEAISWASADYIRMFGYIKQSQTFVYVFFPNTSDLSTRMLSFDVVSRQWMIHKINTDVYSVTSIEDPVTKEKKMIFGDGYGIVWEWDNGFSDGATGGPDDLNGEATSFGASTMTDTTRGVSTPAWTVNSFVGCIVELISGSAGNQRRRILSNTANTLTVTVAWTGSPSVGSEYTIGAIDHWADEYWNSEKLENRWKRMRWIIPYVRQIGDYDIEVSWRRDFASGFDHAQTVSLSASVSSWGTMTWGTSLWGSSTSNIQRLRFSGKYHFYSIRYRSRGSAKPIYWDGHGSVFQVLPDRNK